MAKLGKRAVVKGGTPCEGNAQKYYDSAHEGIVWVYCRNPEDPADKQWFSWFIDAPSFRGTRIGAIGTYERTHRDARRYYPNAKRIQFSSEWTEQSIAERLLFLKPPVDTGKGATVKTKTRAMPETDKTEEVESLLEQLKDEKDPEEKKRLRRLLRARGHFGGLGVGPGRKPEEKEKKPGKRGPPKGVNKIKDPRLLKRIRRDGVMNQPSVMKR